MPEWLGHILLGLIVAEIFKINKKSLVILGALLPDLITKIPVVLFYLGIHTSTSLRIFHTPIAVLLMILFIAPFFKYNYFKTILSITIGSITHILSDITIKHFDGGIRLLFPLSADKFTLGFIWAEEAEIFFLIYGLIVYFSIKMIQILNKKYEINL